MKTQLTFLLSLTFLFLYPSISFSQTFKCEFGEEKLKGGRSNQIICTGEPEIKYDNFESRTRNCYIRMVEHPSNYMDSQIAVDLKKETIFWTKIFGRFGKDKSDSINLMYQFLSSHVFEESIPMKGDEMKFKKTTSHLITYRNLTLIPQGWKNGSLYIPENGKSIITEYKTSKNDNNLGEYSEVRLRFGTCKKVEKQNPNHPLTNE